MHREDRAPRTAQLEHYRAAFPGPHLDLVCAAIMAGNTAGRLWTLPQEDAPPVVVLWDKGNNVIYLAGDCHAPSVLPRLADLLTTHLRPQALDEGTPHVMVRALSSSLEHALPRLFPGVTLHAYPTLFSRDDATRPLHPNAPPRVPDVAIIPLTPALLTDGAVAHSDAMRAEIRWMWPTEDRFVAEGFGTLAVARNAIIGWCTAEYVGPQQCGIGITTLPPYERRGVATAMAARFVQMARQRGLTACWECGRANHGSVRVAEKLGFMPLAEETYWVGSFAS